MAEILIVPIHLDALFLDREEAVVSAIGCFDRAPYTDRRQDYNPEIAPISENVVTQPFQDQQLHLQPGVHLHWAFPGAMRRSLGGRVLAKDRLIKTFPGAEDLWNHLIQIGWLAPISQRRASIMPTPDTSLAAEYASLAGPLRDFLDTVPSLDFPTLPNRWLVTRSGDGEGAHQQWVVESDFLSAAGDLTPNTGITIPFPTDPSTHVKQPFRYLGRQVPLPGWTEDRAAERLQPLTASGYGTPTFAASYANCHSVFGFFDPTPAKMSFTELSYDVVGWYSQADDDVLMTEIVDFKNRWAEGGAEGSAQPSDVIGMLEEHMGWHVDSEYEPNRSVYLAGIDFVRQNLPSPIDLGDISVTLGHTGTEALSAFLATEIDADHKKVLEDQIEAIQLAPQFENRRLDVGLKFQEARHARAFHGVEGGQRWVIHPESQAGDLADAERSPELQISLDGGLVHRLHRVNACQRDYERHCAEINFWRQATFADWYKYMLAAYPPEDARDVYPNIDVMKAFIERKDLARLRELADVTGTLSLQRDGEHVVAASSTGEGSVAERLAQSIEALLLDLRQHNSEVDAHTAMAEPPGGPASVAPRLVLDQVPAPRFWQPNEPVVLLAGDSIRPTPRYAEGGNQCFVQHHDDVSIETSVAAAAFRLRVVEGALEAGWRYALWSHTDWHPMLMEWEAEVFPVSEGGNLQPDTHQYDPAFLVEHYELPGDACTLRLLQGRGRTTRGANVYLGQSILTQQARPTLERAVHAFLGRHLVEAFNQAVAPELRIAAADEPQASVLSSQEVQRLLSWYEETQLVESSREQRAQDAVYTALRAAVILSKLSCLSQALSGFNDALLMHKQTFQLLLEDPLAFADYRTFTEEVVRPEVGSYNRVAPEPHNDFNPIRCGAMRLTRLRLVDSFGRASDNLALDAMDTVDHMIQAHPPYPVALKPCFVQPTRLNLQFLSASFDGLEMSSHPASSPLCGWVLPNYLDNRLMIYDAMGKALGSILALAAWNETVARWQPMPGSQGLKDPGDIENVHLRSTVERIRHLGPETVLDLLGSLESSLANIDPENHAQHEGLALLLGRPLALVRVAVDAELRTPPAIHHGWTALRRDMQRHERENHRFTSVEFPIRLGEHGQLNDGLAGYWIDNGKEPDIFYSPQSDRSSSSPNLHSQADGPLNLVHSLDASPIVLSMLIDPRGSIHATCGVLPTQQIALPPDQYSAALARIQVTFFSAPILSQTDRLAIPLADEPGRDWSWIEHDGDVWKEVNGSSIAQVSTQATFEGRQQLRDGWLALNAGRSDRDGEGP